MRSIRSVILSIVAVFLLQSPWLQADSVRSGQKKVDGIQVFWLSNDQIHCSVSVDKGVLKEDELSPIPEWISRHGTQLLAVKTDADFALDLMWARWKAPGKVNNAENPVFLTKKDFRMVQHVFKKSRGGAVELGAVPGQSPGVGIGSEERGDRGAPWGAN